jgi:hypothetical protein
MKQIAIFFLFIALVAGCKKKDGGNTGAKGPTTSLNGWSYIGKTSIKVNSADGSYQLHLAKVFEHGSSYVDVFYGVKYKMPNYFGLGNGIYIQSCRWVTKTDGTLVRHTDPNDLNEFTSSSKHFFQPVTKTSLGETYVVDWIFPIDIEVLGSGKGEFSVYNPGNVLGNFGSNDKLSYHYVAGSRSPASLVSSPLCHIKQENRLVHTSEFWDAYNMAFGTNSATQQSFTIAYDWDSALVKVSAVTPQLVYKPDYGNVKVVQPLFAKRINEIIPQWNTSLKLEFIPYYFQYTSSPHLLYFLLQNSQQLFVVTFDLNTLKFSLKASYQQPRTNSTFARAIHHFQWIETEPGAFVFTERTAQGSRITIHRNGSTQIVNLPSFTSSVAKAIMDVWYENGKFWMLVAENDKSLHLFSKPL